MPACRDAPPPKKKPDAQHEYKMHNISSGIDYSSDHSLRIDLRRGFSEREVATVFWAD